MQHPVTLRYLLWSGDLNGISVLMNWTDGQDPGASCYNRDTGRIRVSEVSEKVAGHSPTLGSNQSLGGVSAVHRQVPADGPKVTCPHLQRQRRRDRSGRAHRQVREGNKRHEGEKREHLLAPSSGWSPGHSRDSHRHRGGQHRAPGLDRRMGHLQWTFVLCAPQPSPPPRSKSSGRVAQRLIHHRHSVKGGGRPVTFRLCPRAPSPYAEP